jgi:glycerol-3-phosphate acyltransferase PlsX
MPIAVDAIGGGFYPQNPVSGAVAIRICDAGAYVDCSPQNLLQFAILGFGYREAIHRINRSKTGLLNIGDEEGKEGEFNKNTYRLLKQSSLNFIGNIEGKEFFCERSLSASGFRCEHTNAGWWKSW